MPAPNHRAVQQAFGRRLAAGERLLGTFLKTPTPHATEILAEVGFDSWGVDFSSVALGKARERADEAGVECTLVKGDLTADLIVGVEGPFDFLVDFGTLDDLKGRAIAVNKGSAYDAWAQANAPKLGFTYQTYDTNPDAVQAVVAGRAYAVLAGNTVVKYAASRQPQLVPDFVIKETRAHWAAPFRKDEVALRNQVEDVLECMKRDGSLAKLSEKWFGARPAADDAENTPFPGYGVPGLPGYDPAPHEPRCG